MTSKLTELAQQKSAAELETLSRQSIAWLNKNMRMLRNPSNIRRDIAREKSRFTNPHVKNKFLIGGLYFFVYDPKGKDDLDYYDKFPLVLPLERYNDGFLGLNIHYLPLKYRLLFMKKLMNLALLNDNDEIKRIRITYEILQASKRFKEFRPCIKRYVLTNVKSKILAVEPEEWDIAIYLPVHQFKKAPAATVWKESVDQIRTS